MEMVVIANPAFPERVVDHSESRTSVDRVRSNQRCCSSEKVCSCGNETDHRRLVTILHDDDIATILSEW